MNFTKLFFYLLTLLSCWSSTSALGQCSNIYSINITIKPGCDQAYDGRLSVQGNTSSSGTTYLWSTGETTSSINGLTIGNYSVTVTEINGCVYQVAPIYLSSTSSRPSFSIRKDYYSCNTLYISTVPRYGNTYLWSTGDTTHRIEDLSPGIYSVTATNRYGCSEVCTATIASNPLLVSHTLTAASCDSATGGVDLTISGGTAYNVSWYQNGAVVSNAEDPTNLKAGLAKARITGNGTCSFWYDVMIPGQSVALTKNNTSCGLNNGRIVADIQGFMSPSVLWSNGATTASNTGLATGIYTVTVSDATCTVVKTAEIRSNSSLSVAFFDSTKNCDQPGLYAQARGGAGAYWTGPFTYAWNTGATSSIIFPEIGGTYTVTVTDIAGCTSTATIINYKPLFQIRTSAVIQNNTCGNNDGAIDLSINYNRQHYDRLKWYPTGAVTEDINNLAAGFHVVTVYGWNGCSRADTFAVGNVVQVKKNAASCGLNNGSAQVVTYNMMNPTYTWNTGATTASLNNLMAGTYTVTVTDNNCSVVETVVIDNAGAIMASIQASTPCEPTVLSAVAMGGAAPYSYLWNNGSSGRQLFNPIVGNTYSVTITDANGCAHTANYLVSTHSSLGASYTSIDATCSNQNGQATVIPIGGTAPYGYQWSTGGGSMATITNLFTGQYTVTVLDNNGCQIQVPVIIGGQVQANVQASISTAGMSNTGAIDLTVTGINNPTYNWSNGAITEDLTNIGVGNYIVSITDGITGCVTVRSYVVTSGIDTNISIISGYLRGLGTTNSCVGGNLLPYKLIRLLPSGQLTFTDASGYYEFDIITAGNYTIEPVNNTSTDSVICPSSGSIVLNGIVMGNHYGNNDFNVGQLNVFDLSVRITPANNATPGGVYKTWVEYCNRGGTPITNATIEYDYGTVLDYITTSHYGFDQVIGTNIPNNQVGLSIHNLQIGECRRVNTLFRVPTGTMLGTPLDLTARIYPIIGDDNSQDNIYNIQQVVVASYDPNDKQVGPYRTGNAWDGGAIYQTDNTLDYTIRFQNTGTAPAQFVVIRDTLDVNLLPETVRAITSKHNMDITLENGNVLVFTFNNINLPDSSVSQEQSMGFVHFKIDRVAGLPVGTQISNQAAIYFDYNAPIYTNTP
ncbi:MAG: SprB repeat-containing protein, partial [Aureispira sp.]